MVYYNPYYAFLFLWSLVWTLEVKNDKGLPLYPGCGFYSCTKISSLCNFHYIIGNFFTHAYLMTNDLSAADLIHADYALSKDWVYRKKDTINFFFNLLCKDRKREIYDSLVTA